MSESIDTKPSTKYQDTSVETGSNKQSFTVTERLSVLPNDPLRRDFLAEMCENVSRIAANASYAIINGQDRLYEAQVDLMRTVMREALRTYKELKDINNV